MNKSELIEKIAAQTGHQKKEAAAIVTTILDTMAQELSNATGNREPYYGRLKTALDGRRIEIRGFGSFTVKSCVGYTGRNPKTGEKITVEPKLLPIFKVGKELRERVGNGWKR